MGPINNMWVLSQVLAITWTSADQIHWRKWELAFIGGGASIW